MKYKIALPVLLIILHACVYIDKEDQLFGSYELNSKEGHISLNLKSDHSYSERIKLPDNSERLHSGRWQWKDRKVCWEQLQVPPRVMGDYDDLKPEMRPKSVDGLSQFDYCVEAHWERGMTILEINPDTADNFVKRK